MAIEVPPSASAPVGRIIGEEPKPRVLLSWEGPSADRVAEVLSLHAPTLRMVDTLGYVRQDEYDVLVTNRMDRLLGGDAVVSQPKMPSNHLFVISFAPPLNETASWGQADPCFSEPKRGVNWKQGFLSKLIVVPDDLLPAAWDLVHDDLLPVAHARASHTHFEVRQYAPSSNPGERPRPPALPPDAFKPNAFLKTGGRDPQVLAGWYRRSLHSEGWVVPSDVIRPWDWAAAAIQHWSVTYRRFPLVGGWWNDQRWQTRAETEATRTREALKAELSEVTARLELEIAGATAVVEATQAEAAGGSRRLLTEKGEPLKQAVKDALDQIGFSVTDLDLEGPPHKGGKTEDLRVVDPDDPEVDPIIEVKGYDHGAKAGDLASIMRHLIRAVNTDRSPTSIWWVINHWRKRTPDERGVVLAGEEAMIREQAGADVPLVVIDSRQLFQAIRGIEAGIVTPAAVRASLRAARGHWGGVL